MCQRDIRKKANVDQTSDSKNPMASRFDKIDES